MQSTLQRCVIYLRFPPTGLLIASTLVAGCLAAQGLEVSLSYQPPGPTTFRFAVERLTVLGAFRFRATSVPVDVSGFEFEGIGTGNFTKDLKPTTGIQAWLDDGDGAFNEQSDQLLASGSGAPAMTLTFSNAITVGQGIPPEYAADVWVVISVVHLEGVGQHPRTYSVSIADTGDVSTNATSAAFGPTHPTTPPITIIPPLPAFDNSSILPWVAYTRSAPFGWPTVATICAIYSLRRRRAAAAGKRRVDAVKGRNTSSRQVRQVRH
jgi:hypothetical protein